MCRWSVNQCCVNSLRKNVKVTDVALWPAAFHPESFVYLNTSWQTSARLLFPTTLTFPKPLILGHMNRKTAHLYGLAKLRKCRSVGLHGHRVRANDITVTLVNNSGNAVDLTVVQDWRNSTRKKKLSDSFTVKHHQHPWVWHITSQPSVWWANLWDSPNATNISFSWQTRFEIHRDECGAPSLTQGHKSQETNPAGFIWIRSNPERWVSSFNVCSLSFELETTGMLLQCHGSLIQTAVITMMRRSAA